MLRIFHIFDVLAEPDKKDKEYKDVTPPTGKNKFEAKLTSDMSSSCVVHCSEDESSQCLG